MDLNLKTTETESFDLSLGTLSEESRSLQQPVGNISGAESAVSMQLIAPDCVYESPGDDATDPQPSTSKGRRLLSLFLPSHEAPPPPSNSLTATDRSRRLPGHSLPLGADNPSERRAASMRTRLVALPRSSKMRSSRQRLRSSTPPLPSHLELSPAAAPSKIRRTPNSAYQMECNDHTAITGAIPIPSISPAASKRYSAEAPFPTTPPPRLTTSPPPAARPQHRTVPSTWSPSLSPTPLSGPGGDRFSNVSRQRVSPPASPSPDQAPNHRRHLGAVGRDLWGGTPLTTASPDPSLPFNLNSHNKSWSDRQTPPAPTECASPNPSMQSAHIVDTVHVSQPKHSAAPPRGLLLQAATAAAGENIPTTRDTNANSTPLAPGSSTVKPNLPPAGQAAKRYSGLCFLVAVLLVIGYEYFVYVGFVVVPSLLQDFNKFVIVVVILFHVFFGLTMWSFIQCVITDPGKVPPNWGFYMGDKNKRRRYCQVCNIWKPDRTHHCSACGRCVLNMDHHCPWINNCVGFFNRKFFIQLLCYALSSCIIASAHSGWYLLYGFVARNPSTKPLSHKAEYPSVFAYEIISNVFVVLMLFIAVALIIPLIPFLRFHLGLLRINSTTIENLIESRQGTDGSKYDLGTRRNIEQVMSRCTTLWWLPLHTTASRPVGDGVRWRQGYLSTLV